MSPANSRPPRLLGVFAHPDDEVFCAGGTFAKYVAAGAEAMVVSATRGQAGQIRDARAATRRTLGQTREKELRESCSRLGVQQAVCLDHEDGRLAGADPQALAAELARIVASFRPDVILTFGPDGAYGHPDHIAISRATRKALAPAPDAENGCEEVGDETPSPPCRLYHSHFPRSRLLLSDRLAQWLVELNKRFRGPADFVKALSLFAGETTTMGFAGDFVDVCWYPDGTYIVEQGEPATSLYLVLAGHADVLQEDDEGKLRLLRRLGAGEFFGELGVAYRAPRSAHVVARQSVTCLVLSALAPSAFSPRAGPGSVDSAGDALLDEPTSTSATTCIDVSGQVQQKLQALAAHRTQYPIDPQMFPLPMLYDMFRREYFVRVHPPAPVETDLLGERDAR